MFGRIALKYLNSVLEDKMREYYQMPEPYLHGMLDVGDENYIYWNVSGNPKGKPALFLHGGPGQGSSPGMRRGFNPTKYRVVLFDQRGCGRSRPHASDPKTEMRHNTTPHLLRDMEHLREHRGIERWLVCGGSWGSTLALAYDQSFPHRVSQIVHTSITTSQRSEAEWLYKGAAKFFPAEFEAFESVVPASERGNLLSAYARLMEHPDHEVRAQTANAWCTWEDAIVSLEPNAKPNLYSNQPSTDLLGFVRICTHYAANGAWLEEGELLRNAERLAGIPGVLIHGRLDLSCPLDIPWQLARAWPNAELIALADSGHQASDSKRA